MDEKVDGPQVIRIPVDMRGKQVLVFSNLPEFIDKQKLSEDVRAWLNSDDPIYAVFSNTDIRVELVRISRGRRNGHGR